MVITRQSYHFQDNSIVSQHDYNITYRTRFTEQTGDCLMTTVTVVAETEQRYVALYLNVMKRRDGDYSHDRLHIC